MKRKLSLVTREKMRAAARLKPRNERGVFIAKAPSDAEEEDASGASIEPAKSPAEVPELAKPRRTRLSRKTLVARVSTSIERELLAVEQVLGEQGASVALDAETERRARTLASLARTLRELSQLDQTKKKPKADDDDAIPRDIDELRRELARRLDRLIADAKATYPDRPGIAVDGGAD